MTATQGKLRHSTRQAGRPRRLAVVILIASTACATPYAYSFRLVDDGAQAMATPAGQEVVEDSDIRAELLIDPTGQRAILLNVTNKTEQILQIQWANVTATRSDGLKTTLRPDVDLGWIKPGEKQVARLIPFVLPPSGDAALTLEGQRVALELPMIVRRELKRYRYTFSVHVQKREAR
jgi:hypothetical protein